MSYDVMDESDREDVQANMLGTWHGDAEDLRMYGEAPDQAWGPSEDGVWGDVLGYGRLDYFYTENTLPFVNARDSYGDWVFGD